MKKVLFQTTLLLLFCIGIFAQTSKQPETGDGSQTNPYRISSLSNLYWISESSERWSYHYIQTSDIDASETINWHDGAGWSPIGYYLYEGDYNNSFTGSYDGQGHTIDNLYINRPNEDKQQGLFGIIYLYASISNLGVTNVDITGDESVGGLVGWSYCYSNIINCFVTGNISGNSDVGGIAGAIMTECSIKDSYFIGDVEGDLAGGITGFNVNSSVINSYSKGSVSGDGVGGLVGINTNSAKIKNSYNKSNVTGNAIAGGLVAQNLGNSSVNNCYSKGDVTGNNQVGGLIGFIWEASVTNSYSIGSVTGGTEVGGLIGFNLQADVTNSYWDMETSGQTSSQGGTGRTTDEMTYPHSNNTYTGWDFQNIWSEDINHSVNKGYPFLMEKPTSISKTTNQIEEILVYPNPFRSEITIRFNYSGNDPVKLIIYNTAGQTVKVVDSFSKDNKGYYFVWHSNADNNTDVLPGVYFAVIRSNTKLLGSSKILLIK